jgi:pimeloyl-ACP methyl ester carboxylesterase
MARSISLVSLTALGACGVGPGAPSLDGNTHPVQTKPNPQLDIDTKDPNVPSGPPSDLYVRSFGDAHAKPVIFIHATGANAFPFEVGTADAVANRGYHVITYDQRGCGRSPLGTAADYSDQRSIQDLDVIIHSLGLAAPVLVGHGSGGALALEYAKAHPSTVGGVMLVSAPLDLPKTYFDAQVSCIARYQSTSDAQSAEDLQAIHAKMFPNGFTAPFAFGAKDVVSTVQHAQLCGLMNAGQQTNAGLAFWQAVVDGALFLDHRWNVVEDNELNDDTGDLDFFGALSDSQVPLAAVYGDQDPFVILDQASKVQTALGADHFRWISGAGQYPFLDDPSDFADALAQQVRALAP